MGPLLRVAAVFCLVTYGSSSSVGVPNGWHGLEIQRLAVECNMTQATLLELRSLFVAHQANHTKAEMPRWTEADWDRFDEQCARSETAIEEEALAKATSDEQQAVKCFFTNWHAKCNRQHAQITAILTRLAQHCRLSHDTINHTVETFDQMMKLQHPSARMPELPMTIVQLRFGKTRDAVLVGASAEDRPRLETFLLRARVQYLRRYVRHLAPPGVESRNRRAHYAFVQTVMTDAHEAGLGVEESNRIVDLFEDDRIADESLDKGRWTAKDWSAYRSKRASSYRALVELAVNDSTEPEKTRTAFKLMEMRHADARIRDRVAFLESVREAAKHAGLRQDTTSEIIKELKKYDRSAHSYIGITEDEDLRVVAELTLAFGEVKGKILSGADHHLHRHHHHGSEKDAIDHFFAMLTYTTLHHQYVGRHHNARRPTGEELNRKVNFTNYVEALADECHLSTDSVNVFLTIDEMKKPNFTECIELNKLSVFKRKSLIIERMKLVENETFMVAADGDSANIACFIKHLEEQFVGVNKDALYNHIQDDESYFAGKFRRNLKAGARRVNMSVDDLRTLMQILKELKPNVQLPEDDNPSLSQIGNACVTIDRFLADFTRLAHNRVVNKGDFDRLSRILWQHYSHPHLSSMTLSEYGYISDAPWSKPHYGRERSHAAKPRRHQPKRNSSQANPPATTSGSLHNQHPAPATPSVVTTVEGPTTVAQRLTADENE